jgi:hypothetical protein
MSGRDRDRERDRRAAAAASARTNEYFVPKDGIDREVITADICRYLGNDALVRPGNYEVGVCNQNNQTKRKTDCFEEPADSTNTTRLFHHCIPKFNDRNITS